MEKFSIQNRSCPARCTWSLPDPKLALPQVNTQFHFETSGLVISEWVVQLIKLYNRRCPNFCSYRLVTRVRHQNAKSPVFRHTAVTNPMSYSAFLKIFVVAIIVTLCASNNILNLLHFMHGLQAHSFRRMLRGTTKRRSTMSWPGCYGT